MLEDIVARVSTIHSPDDPEFARWLSEVADIGGFDQGVQRRAYLAALERFPDAAGLIASYGWFLSAQGEYARVLDVVEAAGRRGVRDPELMIMRAITLMRASRYEAALEAFVQLFCAIPQAAIEESMLMYFLFLLSRRTSYDHDRVISEIARLGALHPSLNQSGLTERLRTLHETQIRRIYSGEKRATGFVLFADLVSSTQYKAQFPDRWQARTIHFLMYTRLTFKYMGFDFLKFIGDEVMMFRPFGSPEEATRIAKEFYDFVFSRDSWYPVEANRFNPAYDIDLGETGSPHELKVKLYIGEVRDALVFSPNGDELYDLIGEDVDRAARLKEMGTDNVAIVDEGFRGYLAANRGHYETAFDELRWTARFKGFSKRIPFYGRTIPDASR